jgi:hypothetical protein
MVGGHKEGQAMRTKKSKTVEHTPQQQDRQQYNSGEEIQPEPDSLQAMAEEALFGIVEEDNPRPSFFWARDLRRTPQ